MQKDDGSVVEEFDIGAMSPVVQPDQVIQKTGKELTMSDKVKNMRQNFQPLYTDKDTLDDEDSINSDGLEEGVEESVVFEEITESSLFTEEAHDGIDDDIKPMLSTLNRKGYKTKYSCSGHPSARSHKDVFRDGVLNKKLYSSARIVFDGKYDISAPTGWDLKTLNDGKNTAIYVTPPTFKIVDGLPKEAFYKWKEKYMASLKEWADKLPEKGKEKKDDDKEEDVTESTLDVICDSLILDSLL